jgi:transcriptional regulator GlxA family with amidase domain
MALHDVSVIALPGVAAFELGVAVEGFGIDRSPVGLPSYDFAVVTADPGPVPVKGGYDLVTQHRLDRTASSDLVIVPAAGESRDYDPRVLDALSAAVDRGARVMSICTGTFVLGAAGLLDGRRCTTHWAYADELQALYPDADVACDDLYVVDGPVLSSAGTAAGLDLVLHVIREEHSAEVANAVARRMVMPPHRDGGQSQFVEAAVRPAECETLNPLLTWVLQHLDEDHTVDSLAERALMSPRTFARRFAAETGTSPYAWLQRQRVIAAQRLLESTDDPVELVASRCGFGSSAVMRQHFSRIVGTSPQAYRRTFRPESA